MSTDSEIPVLELKALCKSFGGLQATREVSLRIMPGDRKAIIGPNGAGKTTLFNLITGIYPVTSGQVLLFAHTKRGGTLSLDPAAVCVDEKDLLGSYSADFTLQREVARLVFSRRLDVRPLITHRFGLAEASVAVALAAKPVPDSLKILVTSSGRICAATVEGCSIAEICPERGLLRHHMVPDMLTTNVCFGGPNLETAYVTLSHTGQLVALDWHEPGLKLAH